MLQKNDLILLLTDLEESGIDVSKQLNEVITSNSIPIDVVRFINDNRQLDVSAFYDRIRKNYNCQRRKKKVKDS